MYLIKCPNHNAQLVIEKADEIDFSIRCCVLN